MLQRSFFLAYRQLTQRVSKLVAAILGVGVSIILMFMQTGFENALYDSALNVPEALNADIIISAKDFSTLSYVPPWFSRDFVKESSGIDGVESALPFYAFNLQIKNSLMTTAKPIWLYGLPLSGVTLNNPDVIRQMDVIAYPNSVLLDQASRKDFSPIVQDVLTNGRGEVVIPVAGQGIQNTLSVRGLFTLGPTFSVDASLITSDVNFSQITSQPLDRVSFGLVRISPGYNITEIKNKLQELLGSRAKVYSKSDFILSERLYYQKHTPIGYIFRIGLIVGIVVGIVFILQALHGIISDNMTEYAVLRAMGYQQTFFWMLIGNIAAGFVILAYIPSLIITIFLYRIAAESTQLPITLKLHDAVLILMLVVGMGAVSAAVSIRKLRKANPVELFS